MRYALIFILLVCLFTTGCNGARETDEIAWVVSIGLDKATDGDLWVTYRIAVPAALAGAADGGGSKESSSIETIKAPTLAEAGNILNTALSRAVSLSHLTIIVISEELARSGVQEVFAPLLRYREFRGAVFVVVVRGNAREAFTANKPKIDMLISRWVHNYMRTYDETSFFLPVTLHQFYTRLKSSGAPLAIAYGINPLDGEDHGGGSPAGDKAKNYLPGELPREGGNYTEFVGMAVFKEDKLIGFLASEETRALSILLGRFPRGVMTVNDPLAPGHTVNLNMRNGRKPKISVDTSGEYPVIGIDVLLEGEIISIPTGINYETTEYLDLLETQVSRITRANIENMLLRTQAWGTDVADFGYYIRPNFSTMQDLEQYNWDRRFRQAVFDIRVHTEIRRTGLMRKTTPIRREQGE
jgi:spore germination protein KC